MTAWNKGFVSPGLCSGMSFLLWGRDWIWYCSYGKSKLWLFMCLSSHSTIHWTVFMSVLKNV